MAQGYEAYLELVESQIQRIVGPSRYKELVLLSWEYLQLPNRPKSKSLFDLVLDDEEYMGTGLYFDIEHDEDFRWALSDLIETFGVDILEAAKEYDPTNFS